MPAKTIYICLLNFLIQLRYELLLDQITPWTIDPEVLVDFLSLPESYFYEDAPQMFSEHSLLPKE